MHRLYFDGASKGNPGPSSFGGLIYDSYGEVLERYKAVCGTGTNNRAEYLGVLMGIKKAHELGITRLEVFGDSKLVINQLAGLYKVKEPRLREIYNMVKEYEKRFMEVKYFHVYREYNQEADQLANEAFI